MDTFTVSLIPHTIESTRLKYIGVGAEVNLEVDVLARYIARQLNVGIGEQAVVKNRRN